MTKSELDMTRRLTAIPIYIFFNISLYFKDLFILCNYLLVLISLADLLWETWHEER